MNVQEEHIVTNGNDEGDDSDFQEPMKSDNIVFHPTQNTGTSEGYHHANRRRIQSSTGQRFIAAKRMANSSEFKDLSAMAKKDTLVIRRSDAEYYSSL